MQEWSYSVQSYSMWYDAPSSYTTTTVRGVMEVERGFPECVNLRFYAGSVLLAVERVEVDEAGFFRASFRGSSPRLSVRYTCSWGSGGRALGGTGRALCF